MKVTSLSRADVWRGRRGRLNWHAIIVAVLALAALPLVPARGTTSPAPGWWMVDTHEHSAFSGDARADLGLDALDAKNLGYNAVFLTDHDRASSFQIYGNNGNYLSYTDTLTGRWIKKSSGTSTSSANAVVASPVHSGTSSLHLAVSAGSAASSSDYSGRGPGLRSGDATLDFWVYPQQITPGAGAAISLSIGGDKSVERPFGYTTSDGTTHLGKSTVLVWQLGAARSATSNGTIDIYTNALPYVTGVWNHYVIDAMTGNGTQTTGTTSQPFVSTGLNALPAADQPADYATFSDVKLEAAVSTSGTADVYFDDVVVSTASPRCPAEEFAYRNSLIDTGRFNGPNANGTPFVLYPAREMGQGNHSNQFNFDITSAAQYADTYVDKSLPSAYGNDGALCSSTNSSGAIWAFSSLGTNNVPSVQASGYPAKDNHPGTTDSTTDVINTNAHGADLVEVKTANDFSATWISLLQKNDIIIGTYGSDAHTGVRAGQGADFLYAPSDGLDDLLRSLFEGRTFMASNTFKGRIVFNLDPASNAPYPARYPVYVSSSLSSASVHLAVTGGLVSGQTIKWFYGSGSGESTLAADSVSASTYDQTKSVPLVGAFTYVRAAIYSGSSLVANTQPIFFEDVASLPDDKTFHVDSYGVPSGCACSIAQMKGITSATWSGPDSTLSLSLADPAASTVELVGSSAEAPTSLRIDGAIVSVSSSVTAFQGASGDAWYYDSTADKLYVQDVQSSSSSSSTVAVAYGAGGTDAAPTVPTGLKATVSGGSVSLTWDASVDGDATPLAGYHVYRNTVLIGSSATEAFTDSNLASGTYSYTVSAFDTANNESGQSQAASATVGSATSTVVFSDDFESGTLGKWSSSSGIAVESALTDTGAYAARATMNGAAGYAVRTFTQTYGELYYRLRFDLVSHDTNTLYLLRIRSGASGGALFGVYVKGTGAVCYRNESAYAVSGATTTCSSTVPGNGTWHTLLAHLLVNGTSSVAEVWLDGTKLISKTENFGTTGIGQVQLGDSGAGKTDDVAYDNVVVDSSALAP